MKHKIPPVIITLVFGWMMWLTDRYVMANFLSVSISDWIAIVVFAVGVICGVAGLFQFYRMQTSIDPHNPGNACNLVKEGIYRFSRNPMYLGLLCFLVAYGLYLGNLLTCWVLPLFVWYMNRYQIIPEEEVLREKFGEQFERYKSEVRRWI
jgi:protein-S-isoprenylcysteine O-methyltransferase Ste14